VANPDLELKRGWGGSFLACPAGFSSFCGFFFIQNKGGGESRGPRAPPLDPPLLENLSWTSKSTTKRQKLFNIHTSPHTTHQALKEVLSKAKQCDCLDLALQTQHLKSALQNSNYASEHEPPSSVSD